MKIAEQYTIYNAATILFSIVESPNSFAWGMVHGQRVLAQLLLALNRKCGYRDTTAFPPCVFERIWKALAYIVVKNKWAKKLLLQFWGVSSVALQTKKTIGLLYIYCQFKNHSFWPIGAHAQTKQMIKSGECFSFNLALVQLAALLCLLWPQAQLLPATWVGGTGQCSVYFSYMSMDKIIQFIWYSCCTSRLI